MGQKVNPHGFRVGPTLFKGWDSVLYAEKDYAEKLRQDLNIRSLVNKKYKLAQISKVIIQRTSNSIVINIHTKKPGVIIGKSGTDIEKLKSDIQQLVKAEIFINIHEVKKSAIDSTLVAQTMAQQLESRVSFRKAMKSAIQNAFKQGAKGIKVACSGRLGGAEIARTEWYREGRVPLHTLRADIDYGTAQACTTYGVIGVKVWIYKGEFQQVKKTNN
jgi:small subunit ribosomal protein S3